MKQSDQELIAQRREDIPEAALRSPFVTFLCLQQHGDLAQALSDELVEMIQGVMNVGKVGTMDLKIKIAPGGMRKIEVTITHKAATPQETEPETVLFVDDRGGVYGADPDQMLLNFSAKRVEMPAPITPPEAPKPLSVTQA